MTMYTILSVFGISAIIAGLFGFILWIVLRYQKLKEIKMECITCKDFKEEMRNN